ncbi:MAG: DUF4058 family protein [Anaerolineae bacterium]
MPSPFPGMDPYLEDYLWPDVHHALAEEIRRQLVPQLRPRYVARIALRFVAEEAEGVETIAVPLPDVEVLPGPDAEQLTREPAANAIAELLQAVGRR